jgi:phospholipid transport system substrate-binding protein
MTYAARRAIQMSEDKEMKMNDLLAARGLRPVVACSARAMRTYVGLTLAVMLVVVGLTSFACASTDGGDPMAVVKNTVDQVLGVLQDKQMPPQARQRKVLEIVSGRLDFTEMARSSLGYNWKKLTPDQQQQFVPLFAAFMEDAYVSKINDYSGQKVQYSGQSSTGAGEAEVRTVVMPADSSQQPIKINYLLRQAGGDWKVYDVTVDDISITANYRNQFTHVINEKGFDALMSAMRDKQQELRQSIGA